MEHLLGYLLIIVGLIMIVASFLKWLGLIKTPKKGEGATIFDFLIELLRHAGWVVVVGIILIYIGGIMIGVPLPGAGAIGDQKGG